MGGVDITNAKPPAVYPVPTTSLVEQLYADFEDYSCVNKWKVGKHCQKLYSGFPKDFTKDVLPTPGGPHKIMECGLPDEKAN